MMTQSSNSTMSRRRFLVTASIFGALPVLPAAAGELQKITWTGSALGAEATIQLYHNDPDWARAQLDRCQREIRRLENLFSLYRPGSAICRLNAAGRLDNPDIEFLALMSAAVSFSARTDGLFDVTVQPLWTLFADHFSDVNADPAGPDAVRIKAALAKIGSMDISISVDRIAFEKPGMAITLNGVAQGYITDRISSLLKTAGFESVLVSLGETYALGRKADGAPWRVGVSGAENNVQPVAVRELTNKAIATSGGYGSPFAPGSTANHLLDPRTGEFAEFKRSVSVISASATYADMASTALSLMTEADGEAFARGDHRIEEVIYG